MAITKEIFYKTRDFGEAQSLSIYIPIHSLEKTPDTKTMLFVFSNRRKAQTLSSQYWNGKLTVDAYALNMAGRALKDRLFRKLE